MPQTKIKNYQLNNDVVSASPTSSYVIDLNAGNVFKITLGGNTAITFANVPPAGSSKRFRVMFIQAGSPLDIGAPLFPDSVIWEGGNVPTWSEVAGKEDIVDMFVEDGGVTYFSSLVGQTYSRHLNTLWTCGYDGSGALGDGTPLADVSFPVQTISGGDDWKRVAAGGNFSSHKAAIKSDGTLWSWGYDAYGQLGDGTTVAKSSPVQEVSLSTNWVEVACGYYHTAAIKSNGELWLWGWNGEGELGDGVSTTNRSSPIQTISGGNDWSKITCGERSTLGIKTDGTLWTWGSNEDGTLGDGTVTNRSSPVQVQLGGSPAVYGTDWAKAAGGHTFSAAVKTDGTLWLWGNNSSGQLGDNTVGVPNKKSFPVQTVAGGSTWSDIACGFEHTISIKTDGTLWTWGRDNYGQLGAGGAGSPLLRSESSPIQTIAGGTNWSSVAGSGDVTFAIKTDGTLWSCGYNGYGQLSDGTSANKSSPVQTVAGGTDWYQVTTADQGMAAIKRTNGR